MDFVSSETIAYGQYLIFQRKDYKKLHLTSENTKCLVMGNDKIVIDSIIGEKFGSTFKMVQNGSGRQYILQLCNPSEISSAIESFKDLGSGSDNRNIFDDGSSQSLTSGNIEVLRDKGIEPEVIIEKLVGNSKTFQIKTEFSQEKYIKKKEKKYFKFITVIRPSIRLVAEILYARGFPKVIGIRIDTLSQLLTTLNLQPDGNYVLVESGFNGVVAATLLNSLSLKGRLIHITPGTSNQKQAVYAMNFPRAQLSRLLTVRLSNVLELIDKVLPNSNISPNSSKDTTDIEFNGLCSLQNNGHESNLKEMNVKSINSNVDTDQNKNNPSSPPNEEIRKRKHSNEESTNLELTSKKPRWAMEAELAVEVILGKIDGLAIACKELPTDFINKLLPYVLPSRPFVVYSLYQEPLVALYVQLKQRHDVIFLRITENWLRPYQVLPERTHPAVTINSSSGYLLSGIKVVSK